MTIIDLEMSDGDPGYFTRGHVDQEEFAKYVRERDGYDIEDLPANEVRHIWMQEGQRHGDPWYTFSLTKKPDHVPVTAHYPGIGFLGCNHAPVEKPKPYRALPCKPEWRMSPGGAA